MNVAVPRRRAAAFRRYTAIRRHSPAIAALAAALALAACGNDPPRPTNQPNTPTTRATTAPEAKPEPAERLKPPPCPQGLTNCKQAQGRIAYVERVDPDGDGDAHFVLLSGDSVTAPGISVIDVRRDLRPDPLPGVGEELAAAGPVYPGSRGQLQIEAVAVRVGR